jgi:N-formylglutamate deformylase
VSSDASPSVFASGNGASPLVMSFPHVGTGLPGEVEAMLSARGRQLEDTDWHVHRLYGFARDTGASWIEAQLSRYVIDLNRPPGDEALYPGQASTGLCPALSFDGAALYRAAPPDAREIERRRLTYWAPYHATLQALLEAARRRHGFAVLLDAHSIRSEVPRLFAGRLPDINVGTNDGRSCDPRLSASVMDALGAQRSFSHVLNGRFKGGYITRHYGDPAGGVHALQIELAQCGYMDETGRNFEPARAAPLTSTLRSVIDCLHAFRPVTA